jgi:hypothetical protein
MYYVENKYILNVLVIYKVKMYKLKDLFYILRLIRHKVFYEKILFHFMMFDIDKKEIIMDK